MYGLGPREIVIVAVVLVLLFGSKKIPQLARDIGDAIRHVKNGFSDEPDKDESENGKKGETGKNIKIAEIA